MLLTAGKLKLLATGLGIFSLLAISVYYFSSRYSENRTSDQFDEAFKPYIAGYTSGVISKESPILISLTSQVATADFENREIDEELFDIKPSVKGSSSWVDASTIKFIPETPLQNGKDYDVTFHIGKVMKMPEELQKFNFSFSTLEQNFDVVFEGLRFYDNGSRLEEKLTGTLMSSDVADDKSIEEILTASQNGNDLKISWEHNGDRLSHSFTIEKISRSEKMEQVEVSWNGSSIGSDKKGSTTYEIPAMGKFDLANTRVVQGEEQYAELEFTDPLSKTQLMEGLITIKRVPDLRIIIDQNIVKVYPPVRQAGMKTLVLDQGIKNIDNKTLGEDKEIQLLFEEIKPMVKLSSKGVILPSTDGMIFPFQAVSLKSVNVKITRIHENNIKQFFQVNSFDGSYEIRRVGSVVMRKTISLNNTNPNDYSRLKNYALDISELINVEPGAIYQIKLYFNKSNIWYSCPDSNPVDEIQSLNEVDNNDYSESESSFWDYAENYYYYSDYSYQDRDNPCKGSYYGERRSVSKNILASDLGIIAKKSNGGDLTVFVTDLKSTNPIPDAKIEIYDYQQQIINTGNTDNDGKISLIPASTPYFLIVKNRNQRGYLKLDDGSSLSITGFDVSGKTIKKGIKGYIYGERGVWRPGDSLHLSFILENKLKTLPENQPVIFELQNPQGQVTKRMVSGTPINGFYYFPTYTEETAPTGNWLARVKVGGSEFTKQIKIETIKPNRLKIKADFGEEKLSASNNQLDGDIEVKWLHGAIAKNLKTDVNLRLKQANTQFEKYGDYEFDDPGRSFSSEEIEIFKGQVDEEGKARISASVQAEGSAPGALNAYFQVRVFEEGGDFSTDRFSIPYYPYDAFVGIRVPKGDAARNMLLTDTNHVINIATLDPDGNPLSGREIEMQVYKLNWRWWWDRSGEDLSNILENRYNRPVQNETVYSKNGKATWNFRINYPEWGRYYIRAYDKASNHSTGKIVYIDWPGWAGKSRENTNGNNSILSFSADKEKYEVGENVTLNIPGSSSGRALISLESGSKVLKTYWLETKSGNNTFSFETDEDMAPNLYVNITLIQEHAQTANDLPIRLYGIIPVKVENPESILKPVIETAGEFRPETKVDIAVSEATGKAMTYTLAVVDEGLLDLTRFKTPDPWSEFYAREALGVKSFDMYEYVIGAMGSKIERILSIGGDGELKKKDGSKAKRFPPVVKFLGPFTLEKGDKATHSFMMPQYIGSVRVMVVAGDPAGAYGNSEKAVPVRKPLMVLATLPRVLGPEEYVALPVNVFAMNDKVKSVKVKIKTDNKLEIADDAEKKIYFSQPGDEVVYFYLKAKSVTGYSKVEVEASSGSEKATYEINIGIRNPNAEITKTIEKVLAAGESETLDLEPFGVKGTNNAVLEVSSIPPINLEKRLKYLIRYPYGCVEQTTSSAFPQLFVLDLTESDKDLAQRIEQNVKSAIDRLKSFQRPDGSFSYWPGSENYNAWASTYAGHFLLEAEKKGYALPNGMKENWLSFQKKSARGWHKSGYNSDLTQAYRLYTLALAGKAETGAMNRLRESKNLSTSAAWRLAAAYKLAGQESAAQNLISGDPGNIPEYTELGNTFGSTTRDQALLLEAMALMNQKSQGLQVLKDISAKLASQKWMSTQEVSFSLLAISKFIKTGIKASKVDFKYTLSGSREIHAVTDLKFANITLPFNAPQSKIAVKNSSSGTLYFRLVTSGVPAAGQEQAENNNLTMTVRYLTKNGKEVDPGKLDQGTDFVAEVKVYNPGSRGKLENLALKQIFPSGWEIHNARMDGGISESDESVYTYRDIRDDRVYTFFDLKARKTKTFKVLLNSAYLGKFYLPATYCEVMYDGTINSIVPGQWIKVVQPGEDDGFTYSE